MPRPTTPIRRPGRAGFSPESPAALCWRSRNSAMALNDRNDWLAITSQEDSQLWVGRLLGKDPHSGRWDVNGMQFDQGIGEVFDFPLDTNCETMYCNIEGIHWINEGTLLAASDKMKKKGKQDFRCREKDQSIHYFVLPKWRD